MAGDLLGRLVEQPLRVLELALRDQAAGEAAERVGLGGDPRPTAAGTADRQCACRRGRPRPERLEQPVALLLAGTADQAIDQGLDLALGLGTGEPGDRLAADEGVHRRYRLDAQLLRDLRFLSMSILTSRTLPLAARTPFPGAAWLLARPAPGGPEVDQHRHGLRRLDHVLGEGLERTSLMISASPAAVGAAAPAKSCIETTSCSSPSAGSGRRPVVLAG